jgi:hypothetical protein
MMNERKTIRFTPKSATLIRMVQAQMLLSADKSITFQDAVHYILGLGISHMEETGYLPQTDSK